MTWMLPVAELLTPLCPDALSNGPSLLGYRQDYGDVSRRLRFDHRDRDSAPVGHCS